jgi:type I restriction enzyme S subunit
VSVLPKGWVKTKIGDVTTVVAGGTPKAGDKSNFADPGKGIAWLTPADLSKYSKKSISHGSRDLSPQGLKSSSAKLMPKGTILFSSRAPIGYTVIAENEIATNQGFKNFVLPNGLNSSYTYYYLKSIKHIAESMGTGTTFKELSGAVAKTLPFVLAPTNEQIRIADKLDSMLAKVDAAQARLDKIPSILKRFRQSVLAAATSGELTKEWRETSKIDLSVPEILKNIEMERLQKLTNEVRNGNLESKRVLNKIKKHNFIQPTEELPPEWKWSSLLSSMERVVDCHNKTAPYTSDGIFLIRTSDIRDGEIKLDNTRFINQETYEYWSKRCPPKSKDIILTREAPMGEAGIVPDGIKLCMGQRMMLLRPLHDYIDEKYVLYSLMSDDSQKRMMLGAVGTGVKHLRVGDVEDFAIKICPFEEQKEIVRRVESLFTMADIVENQYKDAKAKTNRLTQSILAKAFRGELVAQDSNDESAELLLRKIQQVYKTDVKSKKKK